MRYRTYLQPQSQKAVFPQHHQLLRLPSGKEGWLQHTQSSNITDVITNQKWNSFWQQYE